ncbi:MAG TPA: putative metal-binding motif-containing protein [Thermoanaerobaculia bacterium]
MPRRLVRLLSAAALAAAVAAAAPAHAASPPAPDERDWLLPSEAAPGGGELRRVSAAAEAGPPCPTCGEAAVYRTFAGNEHPVVRYSGRHVDVLFPPEWPALFSAAEILALVDTADRTYELLAELVGREPGGMSRLPIAFVPPSCGIACGFIGHKGVEISPLRDEDGAENDLFLAQIRQTAEHRVPFHILLHEMAHNFDVYSTQLHYHDDSSHFWTDLLFYAYVHGMMEGDLHFGESAMAHMQWFERERSWMEAKLLSYLNHPGRSWQACVRDDACGNLLPRESRVGVPLAVFAAAGPEAAPRAMDFLRQWQQANPQQPPTPEDREGLWIEALAAGAGADLTGCLAPLGWLESPALAARLAQHGPPAAFCQDADGDGVIGLLGDCAPGDPAVAPGRPEVPNGVDDDCNGLVDEQVVSLPGPSRNAGRPTAVPAPPVAAGFDLAEGASFLGVTAPAGRVRTRVCSPPGGFQGFVSMQSASSPSAAALVDRGGCSSRIHAGGAGWLYWLDVDPDFGDVPGAARVEIGTAPPWPAPWGGVGLLPLAGGGFELSAAVADPSAFRQPADRVLFQVSGHGTVGTVPLGPGATASLVWSAETAPGPHFVYAQPYAGEEPAGPPLRSAFDPSLLAPCVAGPETACLLGGRFEVRGTMQDFESPPNTVPVRVMSFPGGRAESGQAAFFESFQPGNFEIGVKMVDGCALPEDHPLHAYWLFAGGLTSADTLVRVEDTASGAVVEWTNPPGNLPQTTGDTQAFACGGSPAPGACVPGDQAACLLGRFRVSGEMKDFESPPNAHPLRVMALPGGRAETDQAAFFESFQPGNFEIGVKMVDACALPPGDPARFYWLFAGGLTSARTDLTIRQVGTGQVVEWTNPAGSLPRSTADTAAFPCP